MLLCSPPTPGPLGPRLRFPLPVASLDADAFSVPFLVDYTCARIRVVRRRRATGSPSNREASREARTSQGTGPFSSYVLWSDTPPDTLLSWPKTPEGDCCCLQAKQALGIQQDYRFRGRSPTARTCACLRFAVRVSKTGTRRATSSGGRTLGRAGRAPAGRCTKFHEVIASSNPLRRAGPGCTVFLLSVLHGKHYVALHGGVCPCNHDATMVRRT